MRLLVIGGSGYLGSLLTPLLAEHHTLRIFDLKPPPHTDQFYIQGSVGDPAALASAMAGCEAVLYMAMGSHRPTEGYVWDSIENRADAFEVNVKGLYLALYAAQQAGVSHAVYTSSLSVYQENGTGRYMSDEDLPPDSTHFYGFTKRLGEEVCRNACREWGMSVNALRLCLPMEEARWLRETQVGQPTMATTTGDTARALLTALEYKAGFQAFTISGDYEQKMMSLAKAKRLLGWEPLARPVLLQTLKEA